LRRRTWVGGRVEPRAGDDSSRGAALNKCVGAAFEDRLISNNPVEKLPLPRIERREMRFLTADEVMRLAETIDRRYRAFVLLGGFCGLRLGEMLGLRWGRVDLLRRRVHVAETLVDIGGHISFGPPKTKAAVRSVPLPRFVVEDLARSATANIAADRLVFKSPEGMPIRATLFRRRFWAPAVDASGVSPFRIHDLRHTAVSLWIADGANPKQIAVMAGHTSVSVVLDLTATCIPSRTTNSWIDWSAGQQPPGRERASAPPARSDLRPRRDLERVGRAVRPVLSDDVAWSLNRANSTRSVGLYRPVSASSRSIHWQIHWHDAATLLPPSLTSHSGGARSCRRVPLA
jgi:hypothetical protein